MAADAYHSIVPVEANGPDGAMLHAKAPPAAEYESPRYADDAGGSAGAAAAGAAIMPRSISAPTIAGC